MKRVQINPKIGKLPAKDLSKWIADRKKARSDIDWEGEVKKLKEGLKDEPVKPS